MAGTVDVGEAFELIYTGPAGATVTATWLDPGMHALEDQAPVPAGDTPTAYPHTFIATSPGVWTARFTAATDPSDIADIEDFWVRARPVAGPAPLATLGDVGERFGTMTAAEEGLAKSLLRAASQMIRHNLPQIDANIVAGTVDAEVAGAAVTNMVVRVMTNPRQLRSQTIGPIARTFDTTAAAGQLVVTADDLAACAPAGQATGAEASAMGTIRLTAGLAPPVRRWGSGWLLP